MKKLFISIMMLISVISYAATPIGGEKVARHLQAALEKEFAGAQYIVWQSLKDHDIYHAKFIYNNEQINAFFEQDGNLLAIGRFIAPSSLPLSIVKNISNKYPELEVKDAIEYTKSGETSYVITLENEKVRTIIQAYSSGSLYVFKKEKKNLAAKL